VKMNEIAKQLIKADMLIYPLTLSTILEHFKDLTSVIKLASEQQGWDIDWYDEDFEAKLYRIIDNHFAEIRPA